MQTPPLQAQASGNTQAVASATAAAFSQVLAAPLPGPLQGGPASFSQARELHFLAVGFILNKFGRIQNKGDEHCGKPPLPPVHPPWVQAAASGTSVAAVGTAAAAAFAAAGGASNAGGQAVAGSFAKARGGAGVRGPGCSSRPAPLLRAPSPLLGQHRPAPPPSSCRQLPPPRAREAALSPALWPSVGRGEGQGPSHEPAARPPAQAASTQPARM